MTLLLSRSLEGEDAPHPAYRPPSPSKEKDIPNYEFKMSNIICFQSAAAALTSRAVDVLARTIWGEARSDGQAGMEAVACVVNNRVAYAQSRVSRKFWWGNDIVSVCQMQKQFSCWNRTDPNYQKLLTVTVADPAFYMAVRIAKWAVCSALQDITKGATHYHTRNILPQWAVGAAPLCVVGHHVFYRITG